MTLRQPSKPSFVDYFGELLQGNPEKATASLLEQLENPNVPGSFKLEDILISFLTLGVGSLDLNTLVPEILTRLSAQNNPSAGHFLRRLCKSPLLAPRLTSNPSIYLNPDAFLHKPLRKQIHRHFRADFASYFGFSQFIQNLILEKKVFWVQKLVVKSSEAGSGVQLHLCGLPTHFPGLRNARNRIFRELRRIFPLKLLQRHFRRVK